MTNEVLHASSGTYELLNGFYKKRLMRTDPRSPWYGKIAGFTPEMEVIRVTKDPLVGCISLSTNRRIVDLISLTQQVTINPDNLVTAPIASLNMTELGVGIPAPDINQMLSIFREAFHDDVQDLVLAKNSILPL